jgi:hypothetical protein
MEAPDPVCVSLFGANAVALEATDGPNLIEQFRLFSLPAPGKISGMTPDLDRAGIKLKRIRPKNASLEAQLLGRILVRCCSRPSAL